ncbi:MAG TPA: glycosyltransferase family 4 protein [Acidothermaceae bacterium]|nr:glycosyltransferase family 4 protein [Acidothermaceae bacterium]
MKIAHVTDCYLPRVGGIERQVHQLATRQWVRGDHVEVITSVADAGHDDSDVLVRRPPSRTRHLDGIKYSSSLSGRDAAIHGGFDLLHIHVSTWSPLSYLTLAAATDAGIPTVVTVHSLWSYSEPLFRWADRLSGWARWPAVWSAVSQPAAQPLRRALGPDAHVAILPNGIDAGAWRVHAAPRDPNRVVIATVGRLAARKRPKQLLRILRRVRDSVPATIRMELILVGDGPLREALQRTIRRHDMSSWVRLLGPANHEQIRHLYEDVDIYVAPAKLESFGIAALEARCAGLPVIAYAGSGIAGFIRDGHEGLLTHDDGEMAASMVHLATNPSVRAQLRHHNLTTNPPISWAGVLRQCDLLYDEARRITIEGSSNRSDQS